MQTSSEFREQKSERQDSKQHSPASVGEKTAGREIVIFLIHGTWAHGLLGLKGMFSRGSLPEADWTKEGKPVREILGQKIEEKLGITPQFIPIPWTGRNGVTARQKASDDLEKALKEKPQAAKYFIAHSYGGNVTLETVSRHDKSDLFRGVICLNTPFLNILKRDIGSFVFFAACLSMPIMLGVVLSATPNDGNRKWMVAPILVLFILLSLNYSKITSWPKKAQKSYINSMRRKISRCPFLCLTSAEDEAIVGVQLLEGVSNFVQMLTSRAFIKWYFRIIFIWIGVGIIGQWIPNVVPWEKIVNHTIPQFLFAQNPEGLYGVILRLAAPAGIMTIFYCFLYGISLGLSFMVRIITHGRWTPLWADIVAQFSVSRIPYFVTHAELREVEPTKGTQLLHSQNLENKEEIEKIADWIVEKEKRFNGEAFPQGQQLG